MKKRIGVTGGTGFIGRHLLSEYADEFDFVAVTSKPVPVCSPENVRYITVDYSEESLRVAFSGCDAIVHLGAKIPISVSKLGSIRDYFDSMATTEALLLAMKHNGIKNLIYASSSAVYGKSDGCAFREDHVLSPSNSYGIAKVAQELQIQQYSSRFGIQFLILRISQVLGYKEYKNPGFFSMLLQNSVTHDPITIFGSGLACQDYIYVKDVAYAISCALRKPDLSGAFNIGSGKPTSNLALAEAYRIAFDNPNGIKMTHADCDDDRYWFLDIEKAEKELEFAPKFGLLPMVQDIRYEMELHRE